MPANPLRAIARPKRFASALGLAIGCGALVLAAGCTGPGKEAAPRTLTVAAAADLKFALDDLLQEFRRSHPDVDVQVSYGSSGNLYRQLTERAPFDIFFAADTDYPRRLVKDGLSLPGNQFTYAVGHLVLWVRNDSPLDLERLGMQAVLDPSVRKIAIANPEYAPYGRAARQALRSARLYNKVRERIVRGTSVAQAAHFVESGAADIGFLSLAQASASPLSKKGRSWKVPEWNYGPIEQAGVILSWAKDKEAAHQLRAFVLGPAGRKRLARYGFTLPEK